MTRNQKQRVATRTIGFAGHMCNWHLMPFPVAAWLSGRLADWIGPA